jgi:hypothetical protein
VLDKYRQPEYLQGQRGITRDLWNNFESIVVIRNMKHISATRFLEVQSSTITISFEISSEEKIMLYTIIALLVAFWLVGLVAHVGGGFIHTLLVLAAIIFVFDLITGRRAV